MLNFKHSLLLGTSIATFAWAAAPALAQNNNGSGNETVIVTGTRYATSGSIAPRRLNTCF